MEHLHFLPIELKGIDDATGIIQGRASVYNVRDQGNDVVQAGAFTESLAQYGNRVPLLWQHDSASPIGTAQVSDSPDALLMSATLDVEDTLAQKALRLLKKGVIRGLSIGYSTLPGGATFKDGVRLLSKLRLWEISITTFPMNEAAMVTSAKHADSLTLPPGARILILPRDVEVVRVTDLPAAQDNVRLVRDALRNAFSR